MEVLSSSFIGALLAILLLTSFAKVFTALSILRVGVGLEGLGMGAIVAAFALLLSTVIMQPQLQPMGGLEGLLKGEMKVNGDALDKHFKPFLERNADPSVLAKMNAMASVTAGASTSAAPANATAPEGAAKSPSFPVIALSFLLSDLRKALELGVLFLVPFVVIDLLVVNVLMALSITQLSSRVVSLPLKLLLFFSVDGWTLVAEKLLSGYR